MQCEKTHWFRQRALWRHVAFYISSVQVLACRSVPAWLLIEPDLISKYLLAAVRTEQCYCFAFWQIVAMCEKCSSPLVWCMSANCVLNTNTFAEIQKDKFKAVIWYMRFHLSKSVNLSGYHPSVQGSHTHTEAQCLAQGDLGTWRDRSRLVSCCEWTGARWESSCVWLNVCIADWKRTSSASIYPFTTICWIHVNVYLKTFKFVGK